MNIKDELLNFFDRNNFPVEEFETYTDGRTVLSVQRTSPAGEDWHMTFEAGNCTYGELIKSIADAAYYFDVDEEASEWIKMRGENGVPNSVRTLLEDAEWKEATLKDLSSMIQITFGGREDERFQEFSFAESYSYTIKDWYCENYPEDELGAQINDVTFEDVYKSFGKEDIYDVLGVRDNAVRERIFDRLSNITELDYNVFYNAMIDKTPLPDIETLGENKYYLNPPLFELSEPKMEYSYCESAGYVEYTAAFCDYNKFFKRAELGKDNYKTLSDVEKDYPAAYCDVRIRLYENKDIEYTIALVDGFEDGHEKEICLTSDEQDVFYEAICDALERAGRDIDKDLKLAKEARAKNNRDR